MRAGRLLLITLLPIILVALECGWSEFVTEHAAPPEAVTVCAYCCGPAEEWEGVEHGEAGRGSERGISCLRDEERAAGQGRRR